MAVGLVSAQAASADYQPGMPPDIDPGTPTYGGSPSPVPAEPGASDPAGSRYPWGDEVVVRVDETPSSPWRLSLRVPSWAHEAVLVDRGHRRPVKAGYAIVDATFKPGDEVRLELPMRPRWTHPDPHVDAVRGCVAVERGPIVYCLESTDQDTDVSLAEVAADASNGLADHGADDALGGVTLVSASGRRFDGAPADLTFIPYHAWGNRGLSTMRVWVPER